VKVTNVDYAEAPTGPVRCHSLVFEMTAPTRTTRTIINRNGTVIVGPTIEVPVSGIGLARSLSTVDLAEIARADLAVAIKRLIKMIRICDPATRQMLKALHEEGRSKAAFQFLADVKHFSDKARAAFLAIWTECGHHIRREVADDVVAGCSATSTSPYSGPSVRLYRGEPWKDFSVQRHGICWSSDQEAATIYARGLNAMAGGGGLLIETLAPTDAIIFKAATTGVCGWEFEYVVDRRRLVEIHQLFQFPEALGN
jgi:hypothetical protein